MRFKHKKLFISGTAVAAAGALGVGALFQTVLSVQASSEMMPGIEQIVSENTEEKPFRILELVNDSADAEIGYYISGQEPSLKLYEYQYTDSSGQTQTVHFSSVQDALSKLPPTRRQEFMQNIRINSDGSTDSSTGIKNIQSISGDDGPLTYTEYQEKYFTDTDDTDWTKVDLMDFSGNSRTDTVSVNGTYQENSSGSGNYTKEEQEYYPIRNGVQTDQEQMGKYRENIQNFHASESSDSRGAYYLEFAPVSNEKINAELKKDKGQIAILPEYDYANGRYGYYENVYTDLTEEIVNDINTQNYQFPGENPVGFSESDEVLIQNNEKEAVQSTIEESNAFTSGEKNSADDSEDPAEDSFSEASESSSVDFDNAYQMDGEDVFASGDTEIPSTDADVSMELQSYETPVESSDDFDAEFSDDFTDETVDSGEQSVDADTEEPDNTVGFEGDNTEQDTAGLDMTEEGNAGTTDDTEGRKVLGGILNPATAGTQENPYIYLGETIAEYPYYQYELIGDLAYVKDKETQTKNDIQSDPDKAREEGDILLDNDQYWYYGQDDSGTIKRYPISIVTGRQAVPFNELQEIPQNMEYDYYYRVEKVYFCCHAVDNQTENPSACAYRGWYYPSYPENEEIYLPVTKGDGKTATHYISEASYSLTPGSGNYDFVPGGETSCQVEVDHFYYQGGYVNNDWFKKDVFHLTPKASADEEDGEFENFNITVDTRSADDITRAVYATVSGEDTASYSSTDEAESTVDAGNTEDTQDDAEIDFSSEYQEADIQDAGETADSADEQDTIDVENTDEEVQEETVSDETDAEVSEEAESEPDDDTENDIELSEDVAADTGDGESNNDIAEMLADYDLIYVNGNLGKEIAEALSDVVTTNKLPCIINVENVDLNATATVGRAFESLIKSTTDDADGHYVNTCVYFFRNIFDRENSAENLINKDFYTTFSETGSEGFEEISSYIESENKYRELNTENTDEETEALSTELSFARAIEYIINYKYKRLETAKTELSVLAIEPDKVADKNQVKPSTVLQWLNAGAYKEAQITDVETCCAEGDVETDTEKHGGNLAIDGDKSTFWHSRWTGMDWQGFVAGHNTKYHYMKASFKEAQTVNTFEYQPRNYSANGSQNGKIITFNLVFYDKTGKVIQKLSDCSFTYTGAQDSGCKRITFDAVANVSAVEVQIVSAYSTESSRKYASCAELGFYNLGEVVATPTVTNMTSSEYVGHIDDINSKYDMIYIGDGEGQESSFNTDIIGDNGTLYTHVGGLQKARIENKNSTWKLMGLYPEDFNADGSMNTDSSTNSFRGSGNDITKQQYTELMSFVKSGYPVVLGDKLVQDGNVTSKVDNSSYMYKFINEALKYNNVFTRSDLEEGNQKIVFLTMLAKPSIEFSENGKPAEAPRDGHSAGEAIKDESGEKTICSYNYISGEMTYRFTIRDEAAVSPASTRYDCRLYFDLNFDGNLSDSEEQAAYMEIRDSSGSVQPRVSDNDGKSHYELKAGEEYTLTRKIPADYYKLIAWKLEIVNSANTNIRVSETGYSKQSANGTKIDINVLQILPAISCSDSATSAGKKTNGTWDLQDQLDNKSGEFYDAIKDLEDFNIKVQRVTVDDFSKSREVADSYLKDRQMVIIGFDDVYQNIEEGGVEALLQFIEDGKSVIFSHDTTSLYNYNYDKNHNHVEGYELYTSWLINHNRANWGVQMNTVLREIVGMDRYGITNKNTFAGSTTSVMSLLKNGNDLTDGNGVSFAELMKLAGDVAYQSGSAGTKSYKQTQGYTNMQIEAVNVGEGGNTVNKATKVNDGAITQYPYVIPNTMTIATTHGQYYQLALEQDKDSDGKNDIVVWYCLSEKKYSDSPNDVRNNYYFYSKGNVIYTGAGHSVVKDKDEVRLFVNAMVAAANVAAVEPEIHFVKALDPSAETESSRYYMTDQSSWVSGTDADSGNVLEQDEELYFNVKDYNMVSADLSSGNTANMTVDFYIDSESENARILDDCPPEMTNKKVVSLNSVIQELIPYGSDERVSLGSDGSFHLTENNAYGLNISNIEQFLKKADHSYNESCTVYVKVTSTVNLYGKIITNTSWSSIDLKQRQLFEMD